MGKTIAITPSWYWPAGVTRVLGVPPYLLDEFLVERLARRRPDEPVVIDDSVRMTGRDLADRVGRAAAALGQRAERGTRVGLAAGPSAEGVVLLLAALRAGMAVDMIGVGSPGPEAAPAGLAPEGLAPEVSLVLADEAGVSAPAAGGGAMRLDELDAAPTDLGGAPRSVHDVAIRLAGTWGPVGHSHRSVLAGAVSFGAFLSDGGGRPWLSTFPVSTWEGLAAVTVSLVSGAPLVMAGSGAPALDAAARDAAGTLMTDFSDAVAATRDAKREVKGIRGMLGSVVMPANGPFDPDARRRVSRQFDCPALTFFGLPEVGPVFAAHPSWYLDESIGIPVPNAHVVPVEAGSRRRLATLWELVESAVVTVASPALAPEHGGELLDNGALFTGVVASSDPNGMVYLLPE